MRMQKALLHFIELFEFPLAPRYGTFKALRYLFAKVVISHSYTFSNTQIWLGTHNFLFDAFYQFPQLFIFYIKPVYSFVSNTSLIFISITEFSLIFNQQASFIFQ